MVFWGALLPCMHSLFASFLLHWHPYIHPKWFPWNTFNFVSTWSTCAVDSPKMRPLYIACWEAHLVHLPLFPWYCVLFNVLLSSCFCTHPLPENVVTPKVFKTSGFKAKNISPHPIVKCDNSVTYTLLYLTSCYHYLPFVLLAFIIFPWHFCLIYNYTEPLSSVLVIIANEWYSNKHFIVVC